MNKTLQEVWHKWEALSSNSDPVKTKTRHFKYREDVSYFSETAETSGLYIPRAGIDPLLLVAIPES
jgi:hypothetical protein